MNLNFSSPMLLLAVLYSLAALIYCTEKSDNVMNNLKEGNPVNMKTHAAPISRYYKRKNLPFKWGKRSNGNDFHTKFNINQKLDHEICSEFFSVLIDRKSAVANAAVLLAKLSEAELEWIYMGCFKVLLKTIVDEVLANRINSGTLDANNDELTQLLSETQQNHNLDEDLMHDPEEGEVIDHEDANEDDQSGSNFKIEGVKSLSFKRGQAQSDRSKLKRYNNIPFRWGK